MAGFFCLGFRTSGSYPLFPLFLEKISPERAIFGER
jgi:hypothetical protein